MNRITLFAMLVAAALFASTTTNVQAAPSSFVWHHGSPVYVGSGTPNRTHGTTLGAKGSRVYRNWYSTGNSRLGSAWRGR